MAQRKQSLLLCLLLSATPSAWGGDDIWQQYAQDIRLREYSRAAELLAPLARANDPRACFELAKLYRNGTGVDADAARARRLLDAAARQGHADSQYLLGIFYSKGIGGAQDMDKARDWLQKAATLHQPLAEQVLSDWGSKFSAPQLDERALINASKRGDLTVLRRAAEEHSLLNATDNDGNHLLALAVANEHLEAAKLLHQLGARLDETNLHGETALHLAVDSGNDQLTSWLLIAGANPDKQNVFGRTALHQAVERNLPALIDILLKAGANVELRDNEDQTAFDKAQVGNRTASLTTFKRYGFVVTATTGLSRKMAAARQSNSGVKPLQLAVERGDLELVKALLGDAKMPWQANAQGHTLVTLAAAQPHPRILAYLLQHSDGAARIGPLGRNALFFAVEANNAENLGLLLNDGLSPLQSDDNGLCAVDFALQNNSALSLALIKQVAVKQRHPDWLPLAARQGLLDVTLELARSGMDLNAPDEAKRTALWHAASQDKSQVVAALLALGADPSLADLQGNTPLHTAATTRSARVMPLLLKNQHSHALLDSKNSSDSTALHLAASAGRDSQVRMLLAAGAQPDLRDHNGNTALMLAVMARSPATVQALIDAGASMQKRNNNKQNALAMARQLGYQDIALLLQKADGASGVMSIFQ